MLGHISRVKCYATTTSTSTLREHLFTSQNISCDDKNDEDANTSGATNCESKPKGPKQMKLSFKQKLINLEPCSNKFELGRDLAIWAALDLEPFIFTSKNGARFFFEKNLPNIPLPSRHTLARSTLFDEYESVKQQVKSELQHVGGSSVCAMFDGWSNKYRRYPYIGIRLAFINNDWKFRLVTVSLKVLEKHTGENMSSHVREELKALGIDLSTTELFTTHDGAANMIKASKLLRSSHYQHCVAHSLHLLLMTDGINTIPDMVDLLARLKSAIQRLDAKCYLVDDVKAKAADRAKMDLIQNKISTVQELLNADENISISFSDEREHVSEEERLLHDQNERERHHQTLKTSIVTRWNSVLYMIDSSLSLWDEMNEALRSNGDREYCMSDDDRIVLKELQRFLKPFADLTDLVSNEAPHLSLISLIVREIKDAALRNETGEGEIIITLKQAVLAWVDVRLSISEVAQVVTLLDPSLKRLMIADIGLSEAKRLILQHAQKAVERRKAYMSTQSQSTTTRASEGETSSSIGLGQAVLIGRVIVATGCAGSGASSVSNQIESFQAESLSKKSKLLKKFSHADTTYNLRVQLESEINTYLTLDLNITDENPLCFGNVSVKVFQIYQH